MKIYEEFTTDDLQQFLADHDLIRKSKRGANAAGVVDYEKLEVIMCSKSRQARNIVDGKLPLQRGQYNLLALHAGKMEPQLISAQKIGEGTIEDYNKQEAVEMFISKHQEPQRPQ